MPERKPSKRERERVKARARARDKLKRAQRVAAMRTDSDRRARMATLDDASPIRPDVSDLIVGDAAVRELRNITTRKDSTGVYVEGALND